jgi:hypothetical protein
MRISERQLRSFVRETLLAEGGMSDYYDDRAMAARRGSESEKHIDKSQEYMQNLMKQSFEATIDFTKSLLDLAGETFLYFRSAQYLIDAVRGLTGVDITPESQKEWRATIAAGSLHDFLDKFGTAGLEPADLINASLYMMEGNWKMAGLCAVAAIPVVGGAIAKSKAGKFIIADVKALDEGIASLKTGLNATGDPNAQRVIDEIDSIRQSMNGGNADFKPYTDIDPVRKNAVKEVAAQPEKLAKASKLINDVKVDPAAAVASRQIDVKPRGGGYQQSVSWFGSRDELLDAPEKVFNAKKFTTDAKTLFGKIGTDVNVKPLVASQGEVNTILSTIGKDVFTDRKFMRLRVAITSAEDAKESIELLNDTILAQGKKLSADGIGPDTITVIPVANAAGKDTIPSAWMVAHAFFDGGTGGLLLSGMPNTKAIVTKVEDIFDRMFKIDTGIDEVRNLSTTLSQTVNSNWGRNARELVSQEAVGVVLHNYSSPAIGKSLKAGEKLTSFDFSSAGKVQAPGNLTALQYAYRPSLDGVSEVLAAALTKGEGYVPDFSHIPANHPHRADLIQAATELQEVTKGLKDAFNADAKGKVIWIAVN